METSKSMEINQEEMGGGAFSGNWGSLFDCGGESFLQQDCLGGGQALELACNSEQCLPQFPLERLGLVSVLRSEVP